MAEKQRILIVDDDNNIAELISLYLTKECFETMIVNDGEEALQVFPEFKPNLVLLDLMLPGMDGYQVCREMRAQSPVPIIMLSAKGEVFDKVLGLELGADDYMIKPFDSKELVARVKAVLRRYQQAAVPAAAQTDQQGDYVEYPDLIVNLTNYSVLYKGHSVDMPPKDVCLHIDKACQFIRHKAVQIEHGVRIGLIRYFLLVGKANLLEVLIGFTPERGTPGIIQFVNSAVFLL